MRNLRHGCRQQLCRGLVVGEDSLNPHARGVLLTSVEINTDLFDFRDAWGTARGFTNGNDGLPIALSLERISREGSDSCNQAEVSADFALRLHVAIFDGGRFRELIRWKDDRPRRLIGELVEALRKLSVRTGKSLRAAPPARQETRNQILSQLNVRALQRHKHQARI